MVAGKSAHTPDGGGVTKELLLVAAHSDYTCRSYILVTLVPAPSQHLLHGEETMNKAIYLIPSLWALCEHLLCRGEPGVS